MAKAIKLRPFWLYFAFNYLPMTKTTDWKTYTEKMIELCQRLGVKHYIKKDLQPYLPERYINLKVIPQHN